MRCVWEKVTMKMRGVRAALCGVQTVSAASSVVNVPYPALVRPVFEKIPATSDLPTNTPGTVPGSDTSHTPADPQGPSTPGTPAQPGRPRTIRSIPLTPRVRT
jgi:hypothetical protein